MSYYHRVISNNNNKNGYDFNACNNVRDIWLNNGIINSIVKLIVHSPVGKLVYIYIYIYIERERERERERVCVCVWSNINSM